MIKKCSNFLAIGLCVTASLYAMQNDEQIPKFPYKELIGHTDDITSISMQAGVDALNLSSSRDKTIRVWVDQVCRGVLVGHTGAVNAAQYFQDSSLDWFFASGSDDTTVKIWTTQWDLDNPYKCIETLTNHTGKVYAIEHLYGRDATGDLFAGFASGSEDRTVIIWNSMDWPTPYHVLQGHTEAVRCLSWSGGNYIASGSDDTTIRIWDYVTGTLEHTLAGHHAPVLALVSIGTTDRLLVSGDEAGVCKIWDWASSECLDTFQSEYNGAVRGLDWFAPHQIIFIQETGFISVYDYEEKKIIWTKLIEGVNPVTIVCDDTDPTTVYYGGNGSKNVFVSP